MLSNQDDQVLGVVAVDLVSYLGLVQVSVQGAFAFVGSHFF